MVDHDGSFAVMPGRDDPAWMRVGVPRIDGVLIIGDHASAHVPSDIDLMIDPALLDAHIASDIGVAAVADRLVAAGAADAAHLGAVSRLVVDCNRDPNAPNIIPIASDGHAIPGNMIDHAAHSARIARIHTPYHGALAVLIAQARPAMILSLHSFTPHLAEKPDELRPWDLGILYNQDDRLARIAIRAFTAAGLTVGDQLPYSGKLLNYTMNRHAEGQGIPYLGIEIRQDLVSDTAGQRRMSDIIAQVLMLCRNHLA